MSINEKLSKLRHDGHITKEEYNILMNKTNKDIQVILTIPKEFVENFNKNRFNEELRRVETDIDADIIDRDIVSLSGNYEKEVITMLIEAFKEAKVIKQ